MDPQVQAMLDRENAITSNFDAETASRIEKDLQRELVRCNRYDRALSIVLMRFVTNPTAPRSKTEPFRRKLEASLTKQCESELRLTDTLGKLSNEELLIVLPETDTVGANIVADKVGRSAMTMALLRRCAKFFDGYFCSVAEFSEVDHSVTDLIDRARAEGATQNLASPN